MLEIAWANGRRQDVVDRIQPAYSWLLGAPVRVECVDVREVPLDPPRKFHPGDLAGTRTGPGQVTLETPAPGA